MNRFSKVLAHYRGSGLEKAYLSDMLKDKERVGLLYETDDVVVDLTRQKLDKVVLEQFQGLYDEFLKDKINAMYKGEKINTTEKRQVLHFLLRMLDGDAETEELRAFQGQINKALKNVREFSESVRSGVLCSSSNKKFKNIISIGIGGSYLGVEAVNEALKLNPAYAGDSGLNLHFLSNVDPACFSYLKQNLDPTETLVIIISKSFTTAETIQNAKLVLDWFLNHYSQLKVPKEKVIADHFCAVSANIEKCGEFGIVKERVFEMWDSIGGRFSVASCVGAVPISLAYSYTAFEEMLKGMQEVDRLFFKQDKVTENLPVLLGLLDCYHNYVQGYNSKAIIPYSQGLSRLPAHIQQVEMESNGKNYSPITGQLLPKEEQIAKFVFGEPGTNSQHSFFQSLHQGRPCPIDFIGFCKPQCEDVVVEEKNCFNEFMANLFAQADSLAIGASLRRGDHGCAGHRRQAGHALPRLHRRGGGCGHPARRKDPQGAHPVCVLHDRLVDRQEGQGPAGRGAQGRR